MNGRVRMATASKKKRLVEIKDPEGISGLGSNVVRLLDAENGKNVCFIGIVENKEVVWFPNPASYEQLEAVTKLLHKKKFSKALSKGDTKRAQAFADKKFSKK